MEAYVLKDDFSLADVKPLVSALSMIPFGSRGTLYLDYLFLLHEWAHYADEKTRLVRLTEIASCIEEIKGMDAHEMLTYSNQACLEIYKREGNAKFLDGDGYCNTAVKDYSKPPLPKEWKKNFRRRTKKPHHYALLHNCKISDVIATIAEPLPSSYTTGEESRAMRKAMSAICIWARLSTDEQIIDERCKNIASLLNDVKDASVRKNLLHWWHYSLAAGVASFPKDELETAKLFLKHGAYIKFRNGSCKSFLHLDYLTDELYEIIAAKGLTPFDEMFEPGEDPITWAIENKHEQTLDVILSHVSFESEAAQNVGKHAALAAAKMGNRQALRKLVLKGVDLNKSIQGKELGKNEKEPVLRTKASMGSTAPLPTLLAPFFDSIVLVDSDDGWVPQTDFSKKNTEIFSTYVLKKNFPLSEVKPLIGLLTKMQFYPNGTHRYLCALWCLHEWARAAGGETKLTRLAEIVACIHEINDPDIRNMFSYAHHGCLELYDRKSNAKVMSADRYSYVPLNYTEKFPIPEGWKAFFRKSTKNPRQYRLKSEATSKIPDVIAELAKPLPLTYTVAEEHSALHKVMSLLSVWAVLQQGKQPKNWKDRSSIRNDRLELIESSVKAVKDPYAKERLLHWWYYGLTRRAMPLAAADIEIVKVLLKRGAYVRFRVEPYKSFLHRSQLDDELYEIIAAKGLSPFDEMFEPGEDPITWAIGNKHEQTLDVLLRHVAFEGEAAQNVGKHAALAAAKMGNVQALRKLVLKGVDLNQAFDEKSSLLDLILKEQPNDEIQELILGQLPKQVPESIKGAKSHLLFSQTPSDKLTDWLSGAMAENKDPLKVPPVLLSAGSKIQLIMAAEALAAKNQSESKIEKESSAEGVGAILASFLEQALRYANNTGIQTLLSLCAERGIIKDGGAEGRILIEKTIKADQIGLDKSLKNYVPFYDNKLVKLAFASLGAKETENCNKPGTFSPCALGLPVSNNKNQILKNPRVDEFE
ncbi:MAG: hypothetical protein M1549_04160 [Candidatus Dependentiae bacterium]|nr:hypothetical protein [Candidatus Dependentiae bacterium]